MEHRWGERVSVDVPVRLRHGASAMGEARVINISRSGALIQTRLSLAVLARVDIHLNGHATSSFVTRVESRGVGVEWCEPSPQILADCIACTG
ncbi:MAG: PilZ domain-containing protein [Steroidobacteraceae bacterium]